MLGNEERYSYEGGDQQYQMKCNLSYDFSQRKVVQGTLYMIERKTGKQYLCMTLQSGLIIWPQKQEKKRKMFTISEDKEDDREETHTSVGNPFKDYTVSLVF